jgi:hypothetical protein
MTEAFRADDVTGVLQAWHQGDEDAFKRLIPLVYEELRRVARTRLRAEPSFARRPLDDGERHVARGVERVGDTIGERDQQIARPQIDRGLLACSDSTVSGSRSQRMKRIHRPPRAYWASSLNAPNRADDCGGPESRRAIRTLRSHGGR